MLTRKHLLTFAFFLLQIAYAIAQEADANAHEGHDHSAEAEESGGHAHDSPDSAEECVATEEEYNTGLRIGSIFIILAGSFIGIFIPILMHRISPYSQGSPRHWILSIGKFFGTGVILAVAFIHMIPEASEKFESPCIQTGLWDTYEGFVGIFALLAVFFVQLLELSILTHLENKYKKNTSANQPIPDAELAVGGSEKGESVTTAAEQPHHHHHSVSASSFEDSRLFKNVGIIILELGIVIHSIIIGITLGTTGEDGFTVLFIAMVFHQFFEAIALGTRINDMNLKSWLKPAFMGIAFCLTTPLGIAIGMGIHASLNPWSQSNVLAQAVLDSLSAGILLYNSFISLICVEVNQNCNFRQASFPYKATCLLSMYIGAALMALLGKWA